VFPVTLEMFEGVFFVAQEAAGGSHDVAGPELEVSFFGEDITAPV
jgi:hypothetical protein